MYEELKPTLEKYGNVPGSLITVLQKAQDIYGYLSMDCINYISEETGIKPAKIYGVITFYSQFRLKPIGKNLIMLCQGTACHVNGSSDIETAIRDYLKVEEGETTPDGLFTYTNVACIGCCSLAPAVMIGEKTHGKLTRENVVKVLAEVAAAENGGDSK